jgi:hypothetical protein
VRARRDRSRGVGIVLHERLDPDRAPVGRAGCFRRHANLATSPRERSDRRQAEGSRATDDEHELRRHGLHHRHHRRLAAPPIPHRIAQNEQKCATPATPATPTRRWAIASRRESMVRI